MKINPRRPSSIQPQGLMESDRDFVENNLDAAVKLLEAELARQKQKPGFNPDDTTRKGL